MSGNYSDDMRKILDMLDGITETDADNKTLLTESDTLEQLEEGPRWDKFKSQVKSKNPFSKAGRTKAKGDLRTRKLAQTWENAWHDHAGSTGTEQTVDDLAAFLQHQVKFVPQAIQQIISTATGHDVALNGNADKNTDNNTQGEKGPESQQSTSAPQSDPNAKGPEDQQSGTTTELPVLLLLQCLRVLRLHTIPVPELTGDNSKIIQLLIIHQIQLIHRLPVIAPLTLTLILKILLPMMPVVWMINK
jgi:hypothetical protein